VQTRFPNGLIRLTTGSVRLVEKRVGVPTQCRASTVESMEKLDLKRELKHLYSPSAKHVTAVTVPAMNFLMLDVQGDPNTSQSYADALKALYAVSYILKFAVKNGPLAIDYAVMPLEGLWWAEDMSDFASAGGGSGRSVHAHRAVLGRGSTHRTDPDFIEQSGCERAGKHHEIYLTDIRGADPARWKTVIRQPMR
jgi:hypothetical protein